MTTALPSVVRDSSACRQIGGAQHQLQVTLSRWKNRVVHGTLEMQPSAIPMLQAYIPRWVGMSTGVS